MKEKEKDTPWTRSQTDRRSSERKTDRKKGSCYSWVAIHWDESSQPHSEN